MTHKTEISNKLLDLFRNIIYDYSGIKINIENNFKIIRYIKKHLCDHVSEKKIQNYLLNIIKTDNKEFEKLINSFTVNESFFFRHSQQFDFFKSQIINKIENEKQTDFLIWSSACADGCEPYSIAIVLEELKQTYNFTYKILATDINSDIIKVAKKGFFSKRSVSLEMKKEYILKYFKKNKDVKTYQLLPEIKNKVEFAQLNLYKDIYPGNVDFIFCRNVLIYFEEEVIEKIVLKLYNSLKENGLLFLAPTENLFNYTSHFILEKNEKDTVSVYKKWSIDKRKITDNTEKTKNLRKPLNYYPKPTITVDLNSSITKIFINGIITEETRIKEVGFDLLFNLGSLKTDEYYILDLNNVIWLSNDAIKEILEIVKKINNKRRFLYSFICDNQQIYQSFKTAGLLNYVFTEINNKPKKINSINKLKKRKTLYETYLMKYKTTKKNILKNNNEKEKIIKIKNILGEEDVDNFNHKLKIILNKINAFDCFIIKFVESNYIDKQFFLILKKFIDCLENKKIKIIIENDYNINAIVLWLDKFNLKKYLI